MTTKVTRVIEQVLRVESPASVFVSRATQQVLLPDTSGPVKVAGVTQQILIVTEAPPGTKDVQTVSVFESALVAEPPAKSYVAGTHQQVLVVVEPAPPVTAASISSVKSSVLIVEKPTPATASGVLESALLLVEGPIVLTAAMQIYQQALSVDLSRGEMLVTGIASQALLQTEFPTRSPYRTKVTSVLSAAARQYVDPHQVAAVHRASLITTFTGMSKVYPARSVSNIRSPSVVNQAAVNKVAVDPTTVISHCIVPSTYGTVAYSVTQTNPLAIQSAAATYQAVVESAHSRSLVNPQAITASYRILQQTTSYGTLKTYAPLSDIRSKTDLTIIKAMVASPIAYQIPPRSQAHVDAIKTESASAVTTLLNPLDPLLKSKIRLDGIKFESVTLTELAGPWTITSTVAAAALDTQICLQSDYVSPDAPRSPKTVNIMKSDVASPTTFGNPDGILPGGRGYQTATFIVQSSTDYGTFPTSSEKIIQLETKTAVTGTFKDPNDFFPGSRTTMAVVMVVTIGLYEKPEAVKSKRRTSSASVTRKDA